MIRPEPPPLPGAPPYVVWTMGLVLILLALALLAGWVATVVFVYRDAQTRRCCPAAWLAATIVGGWVTAVIWVGVRERFPDLALEMILGEGKGQTPEPESELPTTIVAQGARPPPPTPGP